MKPILFIHFHKAGGTSIANAFASNRKFYCHRNGNRRNGNLWDEYYFFGMRALSVYRDITQYTQSQFDDFVEELNQKQIGFVALEWGFFKNELDFSAVELIVCFRNPHERFISDYHYYGGDTRFGNIYKFVDNPYHKFGHLAWARIKSVVLQPILGGRSVQMLDINHNSYNHYTKMLNGINDYETEVSEVHLQKAIKILSKFDTIVILEIEETVKLLGKYGVNVGHDNKNTNRKQHKDSGKFELAFTQENVLDNALYEKAKLLSLEML